MEAEEVPSTLIGSTTKQGFEVDANPFKNAWFLFEFIVTL